MWMYVWGEGAGAETIRNPSFHYENEENSVLFLGVMAQPFSAIFNVLSARVLFSL